MGLGGWGMGGGCFLIRLPLHIKFVICTLNLLKLVVFGFSQFFQNIFVFLGILGIVMVGFPCARTHLEVRIKKLEACRGNRISSPRQQSVNANFGPVLLFPRDHSKQNLPRRPSKDIRRNLFRHNQATTSAALLHPRSSTEKRRAYFRLANYCKGQMQHN